MRVKRRNEARLAPGRSRNRQGHRVDPDQGHDDEWRQSRAVEILFAPPQNGVVDNAYSARTIFIRHALVADSGKWPEVLRRRHVSSGARLQGDDALQRRNTGVSEASLRTGR